MITRDWNSIEHDEWKKVWPHLKETPIRLSEIAKALGITVLSAKLPDGISGEIRPDPNTENDFTIRVNKSDSSRRQRFTVAHEIAHYLAHRAAIGDGIKDDALYRSSLSDSREAQANRIAAEILMPRLLIDMWLSRCESFGVNDKINFLADKFNVSKSAMEIRLGLKK